MKSNRWIKFGTLALVATVSVALLGGSIIVSNSKGGFNAGLTRVVGDGDAPGGLLRLGSSAPCDSLDPAQTFDPWCAVVHRTFSRNLMAFAGKPGDEGLVVVPDLASDLPVSNDDKTIWTFTLRSDVFWSDGYPVTSTDVKYSIQRLFDDSLQSPIALDTLCLLSTCDAGSPVYKGPYVSPTEDLASIATPDATTLVFTLNRPFFEFPRLLATPQFAPIQMSRDITLRAAGLTYSANPASNGPFVLTIDQPGAQFSFTKNALWTQASDGVRIPKVDSMSWKIFPDADSTDQALLNGEIDVKLNYGLAPTARDSSLADRSQRSLIDNPEMSFVNFLVVNPAIPPLDRAPCRDAIFYALDKVDLQNIRGGSASAAIAHSLSPPTILGHDDSYNPYPSGSDETGNIRRARESLAQCGYPDGFQVKMAYVAIGIGKDIFISVQKSLARVGIVVDPVEFANFAEYFTTGLGSPETMSTQGIGLASTGWGPDYSSAHSFWAPLIDGRKIKPSSNQNFAEINLDELNALLDELEASEAPVETAEVNQKIEELVMQEAIYLPYAVDRIVLYRPSVLTDIYVQIALGNQYDLVNIGKRDISE
jgi:peptide/nickel transport system substrate-binding protein